MNLHKSAILIWLFFHLQALTIKFSWMNIFACVTQCTSRPCVTEFRSYGPHSNYRNTMQWFRVTLGQDFYLACKSVTLSIYSSLFNRSKKNCYSFPSFTKHLPSYMSVTIHELNFMFQIICHLLPQRLHLRALLPLNQILRLQLQHLLPQWL